MTIPYSKPYITQDEIDATVAVLKLSDIAVYPEIEEFEKTVANYIEKIWYCSYQRDCSPFGFIGNWNR